MPVGGRPPAPALGRHNVDLRSQTVCWAPSMLNLLLTEEDGAAAAAREALRDGNGMLPPAIRDDVLLLVSELVTNAVRHAGAGPERPLQVQLLRGPRWLVVTVADEGPGFAWHRMRSAETSRAGGGSSSWTRSRTAGASSARRPAPASGSRSHTSNEEQEGKHRLGSAV